MVFGLNTFNIIGVLIVILLIVAIPILIRNRILSGVNKATLELEGMVDKSENILVELSKEKGNPPEDPKESIQDFMEFFIVPPVNLDPNGIVTKIDKILDMGEERFKFMASEMAPEADEEWKSNIIMTLKAILGISNVTKEVRHNLDLVKKTGNLQILFMLQTSMPLIMRIAKAQFEGIEAFSRGKPIGDGLGCLVVGMIMASDHPEELVEQDGVVISRKDFQDRKLIMARSKGSGARTGKIGKIISSLIDDEGIKRIITVDAAAKLEGETTGAIAEGIGVVIGGPGVDKWLIEEKMVQEDLQFEAVIVKMSPEEAISPMKKEILDAAVKAIPIVEKVILRSPPGSKVLLVGVGNSCGLPNVIWNPSSIEFKKEDVKEVKR
jgi:hypothetical protein